jgi:hypothetical protein
MAISEKSRSAIYQGLRELVGEEATAEMLAQFPSRDVDEPATKADLAVLRAELRAEMGELRIELRAEMGELRIDMHRLHNRTLLALAAMISAATAVLAAFG